MTFKASLLEDLQLAYWNYVSERDRPTAVIKNRMGTVISSNDNDPLLQASIDNYMLCLRRYQACLREEGHRFV